MRLFGLDVLDLDISTDDGPPQGPGDCTTSPVGFAQPGRLPVREPGRDTDPD